MHAFLPGLKYRPPSLMLHCHRVPLFAIQSLLFSFDVLAHSSLPCANLLFRCNCSAHLRLSMMIIAFVVYQA
jgi:hypothetical protein